MRCGPGTIPDVIVFDDWQPDMSAVEFGPAMVMEPPPSVFYVHGGPVSREGSVASLRQLGFLAWAAPTAGDLLEALDSTGAVPDIILFD
ncbi:MAG: hypothetical protein WBF66_10865, partial [Dehalococcoidia bacterium]